MGEIGIAFRLDMGCSVYFSEREVTRNLRKCLPCSYKLTDLFDFDIKFQVHGNMLD